MRAFLDRATNWTSFVAFLLGLWLGYLGAVYDARDCQRRHLQHATVTCARWMQGP
ncbi:MAG: hypothetical protein IT361_05840 [Gemmatimonadaceae bacterium]|nr:hypothetical protein [Gemmatimonadaceae bacterium]